MSSLHLVRAVLVANGLTHLLTGFALMFAPQWFFDNVAAFSPYNRHFMGDIGVFVFPLGVGLLWAARDPSRHKGLIGVAAAGGALHAINHLYDDSAAGQLTPQFFSNTLPLAALAILLLGAFVWLVRQRDARAS
jgi:hypothetical protein